MFSQSMLELQLENDALREQVKRLEWELLRGAEELEELARAAEQRDVYKEILHQKIAEFSEFRKLHLRYKKERRQRHD